VGLAILQTTVFGRVLPVIFTAILWGTYFKHLLFDRKRNRWYTLHAGDHAIVISRRWTKMSIFISCVFLFCQTAQHIAYEVRMLVFNQPRKQFESIIHCLLQEYGERSDAILLHKYPDKHHSNFAYPTGYARQSARWEVYYYYLSFIDIVLGAANTMILLVGIDAVCSPFTNICEQVEEAASRFSRGRLSMDSTSGEADERDSSNSFDEEFADPTTEITTEQCWRKVKDAVQKSFRYRGNVVFAAILAELFIVAASAVFYLYEATKSFTYADKLPTKTRWDTSNLWRCEDWDSQKEFQSDWKRCAVVWVIFSADVIAWALVVPVYVRGLRVALRYNRTIDDLVEARADDHKLLQYLSALNQMGKLYITPFGIKLTAANLAQALMAVMVSAISTKLIRQLVDQQDSLTAQ
jgi:hypothetical protein